MKLDAEIVDRQLAQSSLELQESQMDIARLLSQYYLLQGPEDEDDDDMSQKMDQSETTKDLDADQSESPIQSDEEIEPMDEEDTNSEREATPVVDIKEEITQDDENDKLSDNQELSDVPISPESSEMSPRRQEVMNKLSFPSDLLTLRKVEESEFLQTGIPWSVSSSVPLTKGTSIGPYQGEGVALSSIKPGELVLQFQGGDGEFSFIKVTEEAGSWLSLLKPAEVHAKHNTCVYFEGGHIWCKIVTDLTTGTELVASFTTSPQGGADSPGVKSPTDTHHHDDKETASVTMVIKKTDKSIPQLSPQHALIYGCPFCSVRFSSPRTLEAHLTYYCSKKPSDFVSIQQLQQRLQQQTQSILDKHVENQSYKENGSPSPRVKSEQGSPKGVKRSAEDKDEMSSAESTSEADAPRHKSPKSGETFKCSLCNYVCEKVSSLQRHQRQHQIEAENQSDSERLSVSPACQEEMFCKHCNIQFSSMGTYRGHKEFYCRYSLGQQNKSEDNISESASPALAKDIPNDITAKLLHSPPTVNIDRNGHLMGSKALLHPALLSPTLIHSPMLLQAMSKDMQILLKNQANIVNKLSANANKVETQSANLKPENLHSSDDQPLDLSKAKPISKESTDNGKAVYEKDQNISIKSEPKSPPQGSPVAKRAKYDDDKVTGEHIPSPVKTHLNIPNVHTTLVTGNQVQFVNKKPVPPQQMVSRCVECNIVFYKHENYLIHKEHYCSGRRGSKDSLSESENSDNGVKEFEQASTKPTVNIDTKSRSEPELLLSPRIKHVADEGKKPEEQTVEQSREGFYKYFCLPCKIKFSSSGNLKAHKEFYCPHGKENDMNAIIKDTDKSETSSSTSESNYKCESCNSDFTSARLLKLHICMGEMAPAPLLRCPYCDYITQTENRLSEHMKVHVPTKAFKCNLCGYRGNTARGMRMHGKMHVENREEFTDDNIIEYEEPPLVPIQRNGVCQKGPVNMETELIRMKNEPYKRRRSRKSFEKSENMVPFISQNILTQICAACGQTFGNVNDFVIHLRMHEIAALEAMKNLKSLQCEYCEYIADSLTSLLGHMQIKHPEQLQGTSGNDNEVMSGSEGDRSQSRDSIVSNDRSRSNSVESSRTNTSISSQDNKIDTKPKLSEIDKVRPPKEQCDSEIAERLMYKLEKKISNVEQSKENIPKIEEHLSNGTGSHNENDLINNSKSHEVRKSPPTIEKLFRSQEVPSGSPELKSPPSCTSPQSQQSVLDLSPRQRSPRQRSPSSDSVQSASSLTTQQKLPSPTGDPVLSPKIYNIKKEELSPKRLSPDPKTRYLLNIKQEQMSPPLDKTPKKSTPIPSPRAVTPHTPIASPKLSLPLGAHSPTLQNLPLLYPQALLSLYHLPVGLPTSLIPSPTGIQTSPSASSPGDKNGHKYCQHCDINFTYLSSFLTHKKYYCSARNNGEESEGATVTA